ncbi:MAG TPA: DUF418 domain-containing protein [Chryseolinea sp.]
MATLSQASNLLQPRITVIDALRGFTLLGIIVTHMVEQYYAGPIPEKYSVQGSVLDITASAFCMILITGKFYAIFSFLFGLSFYIQFSKSKADVPFLLRFSWRLIILFMIGFVHHLHYRGDILTIYAMMGFVLLIANRLPDKYLLIVSLLLIFDTPGVLTRIIGLVGNDPAVNEFIRQDQAKAISYYETFKFGTYVDLLKANFQSFDLKMDFQLWSGRIYMTPGLFLLGLYAGRKKFFEEIPAHISIIRKILKNAAWGLLATVLGGVVFFIMANDITGGLSEDANMLAGLTIFDILGIFQAAIYVTGFVLLFQKDKWRWRLMQFYDAGRMGLTTYLMQAFFGIVIFSTIGLGLLGEIGAAVSFVLAVIIFTIQVLIGKFWMKYFYYGPVEWLWRSLTSFKIQPLIKARNNPLIVA